MQKSINNVDKQYLDLLKDIRENGVYKSDRTGTGTISKFGTYMRINLKEGFPLLTTKKVYFNGVKQELLWFLKGDTNIKYLIDKNVNIWNDDAYRWYLKKTTDKNILSKENFINVIKNGDSGDFDDIERINNGGYVLGDLGPVYGKQWRSFGFTGVDQIKNVIETLKTNPDDRRMLVVAYNPEVLEEVALPPCHVMFQFYTRELTYSERFDLLQTRYPKETSEWINPTKDKFDDFKIPTRALSCMWTQRSVDSFLGLPFNIASYALLTHIIAHCVGMEVGQLIFSGGDTHIYNNHTEAVEEQLGRDHLKYKLPTLAIDTNITDIDGFTSEAIQIENYNSYEPIKAKLSVGK